MAPHSVDDLPRSFERHLRAGNKSPRTVETYLQAVGQFAAYLCRHRTANGGRGLAEARGEDIEAFIIDLLGRRKPSTANNRYRGLHAFYNWLEDEEELVHPMRKLKPPAVPDRPVPVIGEAPQIQRLLAVCAGKDFEAPVALLKPSPRSVAAAVPAALPPPTITIGFMALPSNMRLHPRGPDREDGAGEPLLGSRACSSLSASTADHEPIPQRGPNDAGTQDLTGQGRPG
jgi:hypothetical protein